MTTRRKKESSEIGDLEQSLTDEILDEKNSSPSTESSSETIIETSLEKEEVVEQELKGQLVQVSLRPEAPAKRKPFKNTPKFSARIR